MAINEFELIILRLIQEFLTFPLAQKVSVALSFLGNWGMIFILSACVLLCFKRTRMLGLVGLTAILLDALVVNVGLKHLIMRPRPFELDPSLSIIIPFPLDSSFPSGHTAVAFAFSAAMAPSKALSNAFTAVAVCMGLSRVYLCVHYPTDAFGGMIIGGLCGFLALLIWKLIYKDEILPDGRLFGG